MRVSPIKADLAAVKQQLLEQIEKLTTVCSDVVLKVTMKDLTPKDIPEIKVHMTSEAYLKTLALIESNTGEVAWHGLVNRHENTYLIYDILVYPQEVTSATAVGASNEEYELWLVNQPDGIFENIRMQGHSHVNMGVTPSGTDTAYYSNILEHVQDYYIFMIQNKRGDMHARLYDMALNLSFIDVPVEILLDDGTYLSQWAKDVKPLIKQKTTSSYGYYTNTSTKGKTQLALTDDDRIAYVRDISLANPPKTDTKKKLETAKKPKDLIRAYIDRQNEINQRRIDGAPAYLLDEMEHELWTLEQKLEEMRYEPK